MSRETPEASNWFLYKIFYYIISFTNSIVSPKMLLPAASSALLMLFAIIIKGKGRGVLIPLFLGVVITQYPIDVEQNFFASGAHPTIAAVLCAFNILVISRWIIEGESDPLKCSLYAFAYVLLSLFIINTSPIFVLYPIAAVVVLGFCFNTFKARGLKSFASLLAITSITIPILFSYLAISSHHYTGTEGWTEISLARILQNLGTLLVGISQVATSQVWFSICLIVLFGIAIASTVLTLRRSSLSEIINLNRSRYLTALYCFTLAGLAFGPGSVVTAFSDRYAVATFMFLALGIALLVPTEKPNHADGLSATISSSGLRLSLLVAAGLCAALSIKSNISETKSALVPYLKHFSALSAAVKSVDIDERAQFLVLVHPESKSATQGYSHWSSWQLKVLTNDPSVDGLIGHRSRIDPEIGLFLDANTDDPQESYWYISDGRARRRMMYGLDRERPVYTFTHTDDKNYVLVNAYSLIGTNVKRLSTGQSWNLSDSNQSLEYCNLTSLSDEIKPRLFLDLQPAAPDISWGTPAPDQMIFDGTNARRFRVTTQPDKMFSAKFRIVSNDTGSDPNTDTTPPMPILGPVFAAYQKSNNLSLTGRQGGLVEIPIDSQNEEISLLIYGCSRGEKHIFANGAYSGTLISETADGIWTFGKGFKARSWAGEITGLSLGAGTTFVPID